MGIEQILAGAVRWVPRPLKRAVIGRSSDPSRFATIIHSILNRVAVEEYPILNCSGPLDGFRMRVDWRNHRGFAYGSWEPEVVEEMLHCVSPGMTVLDLGAQSGFYTLLLSRLVGPRGSVVAFEPLPANFRVLVENIELNGLRNVTARTEAVIDQPGTMDFQVPDRNSNLIAGPLSAGEYGPTIRVSTTTISAFAREISRPIDFIKMDVEGAEGSVLRGASLVLCRDHPTMLIELHDMDPSTRKHEVITELETLGYSIRWLGEISWISHILATWEPTPSCKPNV